MQQERHICHTLPSSAVSHTRHRSLPYFSIGLTLSVCCSNGTQYLLMGMPQLEAGQVGRLDR